MIVGFDWWFIAGLCYWGAGLYGLFAVWCV